LLTIQNQVKCSNIVKVVDYLKKPEYFHKKKSSCTERLEQVRINSKRRYEKANEEKLLT